MRFLIIFIISFHCFGMTKNEATWKKKQKEAFKYYELKNYEAAAEIFQEMIFLVPYETTALYNLGINLYHAKDYQGAKAAFSKLVRSQSEISVMGNYWLARIYAKEGKIRAAIASVGLGLQNPNIPKSIYQMFLDLVELFKGETQGLLNQGRVYYERARENNDTTLMAKALESLQLAWTLDPKDTTTKKIVQCYLFLKDEDTAQKLIASVDDQEIRKELVVDLTVSRQQISKNQVLRKIRREEPPKFNSNFYLHMGQDSNPQTVQRGINVKSQTAVNGILSVEGKVKHNPEYSFWLQGNLAVDNLSGIEGHNYIEYGISAPLEFINNNYQSRIIPEIALSQLGSESYQQLVGVTFDTSVFFRRYFISGELGFHNSSKLNDKLIHLDGNLINVGLGLFRYSPRSKLGLMVKYRNDQLENQPTEAWANNEFSLLFMGGRKLNSVTSWGIEFGVGETEYDAVTGIETRKDNFQRGKFNIDLSTSFGITFSGKYIYDRVRSNRVTLTSYTYEQHRFGLEIKGDL